MNGKNKCKLLKEIRQKIADENDISYVTTECKFQGECSGTCPKCEAELRYLEQELDKRRKAGKAVAVAGIAAAMVVTAAGCDLSSNQPLEGDVALITEPSTDMVAQKGLIEEPTEEVFITVGLVSYEETAQTPTGDVDLTQKIEGEILTGDVAWPIP